MHTKARHVAVPPLSWQQRPEGRRYSRVMATVSAVCSGALLISVVISMLPPGADTATEILAILIGQSPLQQF